MEAKERENIIRRFRIAIEKAQSKERRENLHHPSPEEYLECWQEAIGHAEPGILVPRKPGRPKATTFPPNVDLAKLPKIDSKKKSA